MPTQHWMYGKLPDSGIDSEIELEIESAQELEEASRQNDSNLQIDYEKLVEFNSINDNFAVEEDNIEFHIIPNCAYVILTAKIFGYAFYTDKAIA